MHALGQTIHRRLLTGVIAVQLFVLALAAYALYQSWQQHERAAVMDAQRLARTLSVSVLRALVQLDKHLAFLAQEAEQERARGALDEQRLRTQIEHQQQLFPALKTIAISDAQGHLRWGSAGSLTVPARTLDPSVLHQLQTDSSTQSVMIAPAPGEPAGSGVVQMAHRFNAPDGSFAGVVWGSLNIADELNEWLASMALGPHDVAVLRGTDHALYARVPPPPVATASSTPVTLDSRASDEIPPPPKADAGVVQSGGASSVDGVARVYSYQKLPGRPLYVVVGRDTQDARSRWRQELWSMLGLVLVFSASLWAYIRVSKQRTAALLQSRAVDQSRVQEERELLQHILDSAPIGMGFVSNQTVRMTNREMARMFDIQPGDGLLRFYVKPEERLAIEAELQQGRSVMGREILMYNRDRQVRTMLISYVPSQLDRESGVLSWALDITELRRSEQGIRDSQHQMRSLVDGMDAAVFMKDLDGRYALVNTQFEKVMNPSGRSSLGLTDADFMPMDQARHSMAVDQQVLQSRQRSSYEASYIDPTGALRWLLVTKVPLLNEHDEVAGLCGVAFDITERKDAEKTIQHINFMNDQALGLTKAGYWHVPLDGTGDYIPSERASLIFGNGVSNGQQRFRIVEDWLVNIEAVDPAQAQVAFRAFRAFNDAVEGKVPAFEAIYPYRRPTDNRVIWLHACGSIVRNAEGVATDAYGVVQDITAYKEAEKTIQHINFLNDQALGLTRSGYWHVPFDGSGQYIPSERASIIFGNGPSDGRQRFRIEEDWLVNIEAVDPQQAKTTFQAFNDAVEGKTPAYESIYPYHRPTDDRVVWLHACGSIVRNAEGVPTDAYGVVQDISEYMQAQQQLALAKDAALEATKAKSEFLANMSHEIRTPLNTIIGMSRLALQTGLEPRPRNYIEKVHQAANNLLGIVNDILDFSKIEAGKLLMEHLDFDLEDVMNNLANMLGSKAEDKGLELLFNMSPDTALHLVGDPLRLGQVLINLGNNAIKFTEQGEVVVGVEPVAQTDAHVELHFWVRDTGIGLSEAQCQKLFQSFSQADSSTTRRYGGTGLGLAISKNLVQMMEGRIWVESVVNQGSTFHFHARFGLQAERDRRRMLRADELQGKRVLVVDDNATSREILTYMVRAFGLHADEAPNATRALALVEQAQATPQPYDVVLMDWKMPPGMDGVSCIHLMQSVPKGRTPTAIMVTAFSRDEVLKEARSMNTRLDTILTKPVTASNLLEAINAALGRLMPEAPSHPAPDDATQEIRRLLSGARLLLVEDNDMNQELATELLHDVGVEVVIANHGREALDTLARDARFDGILMDCQMPVMDGYTATQEIRKNPAWATLPIIAMTANNMTGDREKALAVGMNAHVVKPIDVEKMYATLTQWIHPKGGAAPTPERASTPAIDSGPYPIGLVLPGIDQNAGLTHCAQKTRLYRQILIKFRDSQADFGAQFECTLLDADARTAARAAHTLRGVAGNIGAHAVQQAAAQLEQLCNEHAATTAIKRQLAVVVAALEPVVHGLAALTNAAEPDAGRGD